MLEIVRFLNEKNSPLVVNIYPFLSLYKNPDFPLDFAFLDDCGESIEGDGIEYSNVFDANLDTLVWALRKSEVPDL